jgi:hypothetical protein
VGSYIRGITIVATLRCFDGGTALAGTSRN